MPPVCPRSLAVCSINHKQTISFVLALLNANKPGIKTKALCHYCSNCVSVSHNATRATQELLSDSDRGDMLDHHFKQCLFGQQR